LKKYKCILMILLLKHFTKKKDLHISSLIIISILFFIALYVNHKLLYFIILTDVYFYLLITQFQIVNVSSSKKTKSDINMEIIAEGSRKAETNNLADTITEYAEKFNT
tara:strand:+ start:271 stop:594 length:324 start_codon:yes stop_codon:yes gene_type:complete